MNDITYIIACRYMCRSQYKRWNYARCMHIKGCIPSSQVTLVPLWICNEERRQPCLLTLETFSFAATDGTIDRSFMYSLFWIFFSCAFRYLLMTIRCLSSLETTGQGINRFDPLWTWEAPEGDGRDLLTSLSISHNWCQDDFDLVAGCRWDAAGWYADLQDAVGDIQWSL